MPNNLETVLLLALPASGKSEVRRYLASLTPEQNAAEFHLGPTVQLDDFPYVHLMRRIDTELQALKKPRLFFTSPTGSFADPRDWGTLTHLVNEDYADLVTKKIIAPTSAAMLLLQRMDTAAAKAGILPRVARLSDNSRKAVIAGLETEARAWLNEKHENYPNTLAGKTLVIEFARGGKQGSRLPLESPFGYAYSLGQLSTAILSKAVILYVWVTPEESRRKNNERTDPNDPGSILYHGVPLDVMLNDYGCDDLDWLEKIARTRGTVTVHAHGKIFDLPVARFDNRVDKTSFIRKEKKDWSKDEIAGVHNGLKGALHALAVKTGVAR